MMYRVYNPYDVEMFYHESFSAAESFVLEVLNTEYYGFEKNSNGPTTSYWAPDGMFVGKIVSEFPGLINLALEYKQKSRNIPYCLEDINFWLGTTVYPKKTKEAALKDALETFKETTDRVIELSLVILGANLPHEGYCTIADREEYEGESL